MRRECEHLFDVSHGSVNGPFDGVAIERIAALAVSGRATDGWAIVFDVV